MREIDLARPIEREHNSGKLVRYGIPLIFARLLGLRLKTQILPYYFSATLDRTSSSQQN